jgi:hypothetical protein
MGLFTMMDRYSVCISCINITYTHTHTHTPHTHRHISRLGGQPAVFTVGTPREAYISIIHLFNIDQYTVCNGIMPTVFLPLAAASVLDVAGVLAVVVLLPVAVAFVCFCFSQLLQAFLLLLTCMLFYRNNTALQLLYSYTMYTLMAQVVKILHFRIENTLAE